jgi:NAD(P)-dependent dehydrogenase (short-subunit alcohol dehydrogenase family)
MAQKKVAFVTGAASGLGLATAEAFVRKGYATVLADRSRDAGMAAAEKLKTSGECAFIQCDVSDEASVHAAVAFAVAAYGRVDAAFNSAGVEGENVRLVDAERSHYDRIIAINLTGTWLCMRHEIRQMLKQGSGAVVNCSSGAGNKGILNNAAYTASKHGVIGLTRTAALEYAPLGVRVNAVCPGMIDTPMTARALPPQFIEQVVARVPKRRMGRAEDIAATVLWLCEEASDYVVGQAISVDGGAGSV